MFETHIKPVTRIAPSPTGHLHVGTARAALFNYLFARKQGGTFILRSEDTDRERSTPEFEEEISEGLEWLGMHWDTFVRQSERTSLYTTYLAAAIKAGHAYISKEESKREPGTTIEVIRLKNKNTNVTFIDEIRGEVTVDTTELGDFVIARNMEDPLYHFAVVVDDFEMGVTHIIRGEDHISNTPRQILIQEAIGAPRPVYAHLPLLLAKDRTKLSKRHGAISLREYHDQGFLPSALVNYLALLGWNPGTDQEIFTLDELIQNFSLDGVQKGGAIFDIEKLRWVNREHILRLPDEAFFDFVSQWMPKSVQTLSQYSAERFSRLLPVIRERVHTGGDISKFANEGEYDFAFRGVNATAGMMKWKHDTSVKNALPRLQKIAELLSTLTDDSSADEIKRVMWPYIEEMGKGEVLWPLRVAISGRERSPDPFQIIHIIGAAEAYKRVQRACDTIVSA